MRPRVLYTGIGILLGLGAPLGLAVSRVILTLPDPPSIILQNEWATARFYYLYMGVGSVLSFAIFGLLLGGKNESLSDLSVTDGLTKLYNHRYLQDLLTHEVERSNRYRTPLTCLMVDIDDFKKINDQKGHPFGDTVLVNLGKVINQMIRRTDRVGRYGGEEFLIIMPQTDSDSALPIAERLVKAVRSLSITVSVGLATYPALALGVKSKDSLLSAADQALYQAKRSGKDRVVIWKP